MLFIILFVIGMIGLQYLLVKSDIDWAGLILPIVIFMISLTSFANDLQGFLIGLSIVFIIFYITFKTVKKKNNDIKKMNIKDL